eukprot:Pgem_evm1s9678
MSDFHKELWNPSWTVEKILIGLMSFMYEDSAESIGSILDSYDRRKKYALQSPFFNAKNEIYVQLFMTPDEKEANEHVSRLKRMCLQSNNDGDNDSDDENACRFCLMGNGELVNPCQCK